MIHKSLNDTRAEPGTLPAPMPEAAFFLDIDGTLLEFSDQPQAVRVNARLADLLERLRRAAASAVALISGRAVADIDALFAPRFFPCAGQHGAERRSADGRWHRHPLPLDRLRAVADTLRDISVRHPGLLFENKGASLALHCRRVPQLEHMARDAVVRAAVALGDEFEVQRGKLVFEIKPSGRNKGTAIAEFMNEPPFAGRVPVFVGDDLTDEYGFDVVNRLGGHSVKVGAGDTVAHWRLPDAHAVHEWLQTCAEGGTAAAPTGAHR